jgi:hypothetical protein
MTAMIDRGRTIAILEGYGIGINISNFLQKLWDMDAMVPKQGFCLGNRLMQVMVSTKEIQSHQSSSTLSLKCNS